MGDAAEGAGDPATYLIVLRHVLVAQDIALTIAEFDPGARVVTAASVAEAMSLLPSVERLVMAFVGRGPDAYRASPLAQAVKDRGGRVVLMGEEAEEEGEAQGFAVLARPFGTGNIMAHLDGERCG